MWLYYPKSMAQPPNCVIFVLTKNHFNEHKIWITWIPGNRVWVYSTRSAEYYFSNSRSNKSTEIKFGWRRSSMGWALLWYVWLRWRNCGFYCWKTENRMPRLTQEEVSILLDTLYKNTLLEKQKSIADIGKLCNVCSLTVLKVRHILIDAKLMSVVGSKSKQRSYWNHEKSKPNQSMAHFVWTQMHPDKRVEMVKNEREISVKRAMETLAKHGYCTLLKETTTEYGTCVETVDLRQFIE